MWAGDPPQLVNGLGPGEVLARSPLISNVVQNPFGKNQLAVRCIGIGQCAPSEELDIFRDHWSPKGG